MAVDSILGAGGGSVAHADSRRLRTIATGHLEAIHMNGSPGRVIVIRCPRYPGPKFAPAPAMDASPLREALDRLDFALFSIGNADVTVFSVVKLLVSAWLLYLAAGRVSAWLLQRLLSRTHM